MSSHRTESRGEERETFAAFVWRERIVYRRAARRHNAAAVEWRLVRAECYVCAVDVGVGECAGGLCVLCLCVVGRVCVRFGGSGGVCVQCLQRRGRARDDGTRDPRCEGRTDVG